LHQKIRTSASEEPLTRCPKNVPNGQTTSLLTADVFYGQPLTDNLNPHAKFEISNTSG